MINYRKILVAYIQHVEESEGVHFLSRIEDKDERGDCFWQLSAGELAALISCRDEADNRDRESPSKDLDDALQNVPIPDTPFLAAVSKSPSFKEGQIVTGKGLKPSVVTIAKNGKVILVPKDE